MRGHDPDGQGMTSASQGSAYPILVERFQGRQSMTIVCENCHAERVIDADEITSEDIYECPADTELRKASTGPRCHGMACMKYEEAGRCQGCGKLGFWSGASSIEGCCSRRCKLQAEHAAGLSGADHGRWSR